MSAHRLPHQLFDAANAGAYRIPDPGDGNQIDVTVNGGVCVLTVAASATETRSLPTASAKLLGVRMLVFCDTVGSGGTVAVGGLTTFSNTTRKAWFTVRSTSGTYAWVDEDSTLYGSVVSVTSVLADDVTTGTIAEQTAGSGVTIDGAVIRDGAFHGVQGDPIAETGVATITIADILTGLVTVSHATGSTIALTLDTGTAMDTGMPASFGVGSYIDWTLINISAAAADTATVTAAAGHSVVGAMICQSAHTTIASVSGNALLMRSRRTATNTWITYRLA
jgi:hypothetical protein